MAAKPKRRILQALFALAVSFGMLLICSKNSFLYPLNDWVDVNCFFTVGRGIRHGLVPYLDLYDQKGPLLYYVYALASLISETDFLGVFLIEVILFAVFLFYSGRIAEVLSGQTVSCWFACAAVGIGVPLSPAFSHGGSAEEFFLPVFAFSLYTVLQAMRERNAIRKKQGVLLGAAAAAALWTKYTFCGLYAGLAAAILVWYLADHMGKELFHLILRAAAGFAALTAAVLAWYLIRGAIPALWNAYFVDNLTRYTQNIRGGNYADPLPNLLNNLSWSIPAVFGLAAMLPAFRKNWRGFSALLLGGTALFIFTYLSGRKYPYYAIVMACLAPAGYGMLFRIIPAIFTERKAFARCAGVLAAVLALAGPFAAYHLSGNVYLMQISREETPQYRFAETIRKAEDPTLLNYGFLDGGYYLVSGVLPATRFFCTLNNDLPEMTEEHAAAIREGKTAFLVVRGRKLKDARNYTLVDECSMYFEGREWTYYLYGRK